MRLVLTAAAALSALLLAPPATAQEQRGSIEGTVQDAQHAMLPSATITGLNLAQDTAISTIADATGSVEGDINAPRLVMVDGAIVKGKVATRGNRGPAGRDG